MVRVEWSLRCTNCGWSGAVTIAPNSAEAAQPVQQAQVAAEKPDTRKLEAEQRERDRRSAERKARRQAEARAQQQRLARSQENAPVMAFSGDTSPRVSGGLFGN